MLPFSPPLIGEEEIGEVVEALRSDWITTGPRTRDFEAEFASAFGAEAALALNSCTAGLHVALLAHGIGAGDEVIVPTMTFCATANVVVHVGATPVLVDVEPDTLNIDPAAVEAALTDRTKAVMVVHYAGHPAEMDAIEALAARHGLVVIEDSAHAVTATYKGRVIGSSSNLTSFSFYATKNLTTGEGGMLTGPRELVDRARTHSLHGMSRDAYRRYDKGGSWKYEVLLPGFKYNMTDMQAAIGRWQLRKIGGFQERRREIVGRYQEAFGGHPALTVPTERGEVESSWHLYVLRFKAGALGIGRDEVIEELKARNIGTSVHYIPLHLHPYYRERFELEAGAFPVAQAAYEEMVSLPLNLRLTDEDVEDVVAAVLGVCEAG